MLLKPLIAALRFAFGPLYVQGDQSVANQAGAAFRADMNTELQAIVTNSSGASSPATTYAYQWWADTTNGLLKQRNAANSAWVVRGTLAESFVIARAANTIIGIGDYGRTFNCTGTFTQTFTAAATLADGFWCEFVNSGTGLITFDPNGAETIDGLTTIVLNPGESCIVSCTGAAFVTVSRRRAISNKICDGRLTLTTVTPVTTADVTAATTVYFTPYAGNGIALYNGTFWELRNFSEISIAVPATTSQMYDVFAYDNAGVAALEALAWTNDTTRATALVLQDGVLVKSGAATRRYLGSFRTTTVSGQTEDSLLKRYLWNYYNRIRRPMARNEGASSWTYSTAAFRQANANAANQLDLIVGVAEDAVRASVYNSVQNSTATQRIVHVGIGIDSTTTNSAQIDGAHATGTYEATVSAHYIGTPGIGRHTLVWLEWATGGDVQTWNPAAFSASFSSGMTGELMG